MKGSRVSLAKPTATKLLKYVPQFVHANVYVGVDGVLKFFQRFKDEDFLVCKWYQKDEDILTCPCMLTPYEIADKP